MSAADRSVHLPARTCACEAACAGCGVVSRRVHSHYRRALADTASGGREVLIDLQAAGSSVRTGVRQGDVRGAGAGGLTARYGRRTCGLQAVLEAVALALGDASFDRVQAQRGAAGSRHARLP